MPSPPANPSTRLIAALSEYLDQTQQQPRPPATARSRHHHHHRLLKPVTPDEQRQLATLHNLAGITALQQRRLDYAHAHRTRRNYTSRGPRRPAADRRAPITSWARRAGTAAVRRRRAPTTGRHWSLPGVRRPAPRREHLPPARHGRAGPAAVRRGRAAYRQALKHLPGVRRPAQRRDHPTTSWAASRRISGGTARPSTPTGRRCASTWSSATGTTPRAPTTSWAWLRRTSGATARPTPLPAGPGVMLEFGDRYSAATHLPPARHGLAHAQRRYAEAEPATGRPWRSTWSSTTGTAPRAPTTI